MERTHAIWSAVFQGFRDTLLLHHGFFNDFPSRSRQAMSIFPPNVGENNFFS